MTTEPQTNAARASHSSRMVSELSCRPAVHCGLRWTRASHRLRSPRSTACAARASQVVFLEKHDLRHYATSSPVLAVREDLSEEAAMPGQPERVTAFRSTLRQLTLENCRQPPARRNAPAYAQDSSRLLPVLCATLPCRATTNYRSLVQKLWRLEGSCGTRRKNRKKSHYLGGKKRAISQEKRRARLLAPCLMFSGDSVSRWPRTLNPAPHPEMRVVFLSATDVLISAAP